jgi:deoxyribodipyrimidine photo-lyase
MDAPPIEPTRFAGLKRLRNFVPSAGAHYSKARNFDFGPERRGNVSMLSPYLRHRLVLEQEVLAAALARYSLAEADKFVQEVFWRAYFKGWLEHRPDVWADYRRSVSRLLQMLENDAGVLRRYETAVEGKTGINCFDAWVKELQTCGYLHNHARMWFASIWVFTLELPWQLGADLFYRHLIDGDPASNTLSWRWVCGLHTPGKTYLARASNIANFTNNRFCPEGQLALSASALGESKAYAVEPLPTAQSLSPGERYGLLITEEDCHPEPLVADQPPVAVLGALATRLRSPLPVGDPAYGFAEGGLSDAVRRSSRAFAVDGTLSTSEDWSNLLLDWASQQRLTAIATAYAPVGPVAELLAEAGENLAQHGIRLLQLRRRYDSVSWPHAQRGYFKLKKQIPAILEKLAIHPDREQLQRKAG